jgi:hypothetical protein
MVGATSDRGHRCMRVVLSLAGKVPREVPAARAKVPA